jgi:hypothetical protein
MFSGKSLAVFLSIGPLVGALSTGVTLAGGTPLILLPIYVFGGFIAAITWAIYSLAFSLLHEASFKYQIIEKTFFEYFAFFWSSLIAAIAGYLALTLLFCGTGSNITGNPAKCAINIIQNAWGVTLLPGAICGLIATVFLEDKRYVRR